VPTTDTAEDRLATLRSRLEDIDLRDRFEDLDLRDRLEGAREHAEEVRDEVLARAGHLGEDVRERVPALLEDLEPASRQARIKGWELLRSLVGILFVLPRLLVRLLGVLPGLVDRATEQGGEVADRARHAAASVPAVRHARRRRRTQLVAWTAGGFAVGVLTGWLLGRRARPEVSYEATSGDVTDLTVPMVDGAAPVAPDAAVRE
jgi:hypothetical protein